jgi:hypothetical protein
MVKTIQILLLALSFAFGGLASVLSGPDAESLAMAYLLSGGTEAEWHNYHNGVCPFCGQVFTNTNDSVKITLFDVVHTQMVVKIDLSKMTTTNAVEGGRLLAAVPDPEFEFRFDVVLLDKHRLDDDCSWSETFVERYSIVETIPANGRLELTWDGIYSSDILNLTLKARMMAGARFFRVKIRWVDRK